VYCFSKIVAFYKFNKLLDKNNQNNWKFYCSIHWLNLLWLFNI
jgi:hypothetical protein